MNTNGMGSPPLSAENRRKAGPTAFNSVRVFIWRTWQNTKNNGFGFIMDAVLSPVLMLLIFTYLFGGAIAGSTGAYIPYLLPGILVLTVSPMTVYSGTTLCQDISKGVYHRFRTMPFWQPSAVLGPLVTDAVRYLIALVVILAAGRLLGFRPAGGIRGAALALLLTALFAFAVSWIFSMIGVVAKRPETVSGTSMMILYPLMFASNSLVDPGTMPGWIGRLVELNPISVVVTAVRGLMEGTTGGGEIAAGLGVCLVLIAVFAPLTFYFYVTKPLR
ncbi:ABC transporter permease [Paenibacillus faecis]|nr:ABC transporter permease [Paenibacillus faecis]